MSSHPIGGPCEDRGIPIKAMLRPRRGGPRYRPLVRAYVGLGANLGDREATIRRAVALVDELADRWGMEGAGPGTQIWFELDPEPA